MGKAIYRNVGPGAIIAIKPTVDATTFPYTLENVGVMLGHDGRGAVYVVTPLKGEQLVPRARVMLLTTKIETKGALLALLQMVSTSKLYTDHLDAYCKQVGE